MVEKLTVLPTIGAEHSTQEPIRYEFDQQESKLIGSSFFRGTDCNFNPHKKDFDRAGFLERFLLKGWMPQGRQITKQTRMTAFGSCFAENLTIHLTARGYNLSKNREPGIYVSNMGEGLVNTYSLLQQFEWALENMAPPENLWHGFRGEQFGYDETVRERTRQVFLDTEFFVITLGLSEVWYDELTGGILWRAVPMQFYDASRHKFRVCSFAETKANIERIYDLIRKHVPRAKVLFTLSPIPLAATFRPVSSMTANSVSKSILRAALDEFYRDNIEDVGEKLYYFPSFEIVNELFYDRFGPDSRHPHRHILDFIMQLFEAVYCDLGPTMAEAEEFLRQARLQNRKLVGEIDHAEALPNPL